MFEVSEKAKEKVKEFLTGREEASPCLILVDEAVLLWRWLWMSPRKQMRFFITTG
jgi:hypothetical protein